MNILEISKKAAEICKANLPKQMEIQKRKFLCAIGKAEASLTEEDDEKYVQEYLSELDKVNCFALRVHQLHWNDKIAEKNVKVILEEHQNFDLGLYLDCVKAIYLAYSGKKELDYIDQVFTYVITHARSFGDPTQNMFQLENTGSFMIEFENLSNPLPDSVYMRKITALIKDLRSGYDEEKYKVLNANATYLSLLILRRFVKNDDHFLNAFKQINTHDDYVKLCPYPLNDQLPRVSETFNKTMNILNKRLKNPAILAVHGFLNGNDAITKRVLKATCLQYIEWTGLQMPFLFFKVVNLYGIEEGELWDALCFSCTYKSLFKFADDYYKQYKGSKADPPETVAWFPYCRAFDGNYHKCLSAPQNKDLCMTLAYLVDLKIGFNHSFARNSHWTKNFLVPGHNDRWLDAAKKIEKKFRVPRSVSG